MKPASHMLERVSDRLDQWVVRIACALMIVMVCLVLLQVVWRYGFNAAPAWLDEAARYVMIWMALLGSTAAFRTGLDPKLKNELDAKSYGAKRFLRAGRAVSIGLFFLPLLYASFGFLQRHAARETDVLQLNSAWIVSIVPIFAVIILVHLLAQMVRPFQEPTEAEVQLSPGAL
ncbi:MAG: TRAP transporter small permease [Pseudomonadota bacterium]